MVTFSIDDVRADEYECCDQIGSCRHKDLIASLIGTVDPQAITDLANDFSDCLDKAGIRVCPDAVEPEIRDLIRRAVCRNEQIEAELDAALGEVG